MRRPVAVSTLAGMANLLSILIGLICSPIVFVGAIPLLGWMNWLMLPLVTIGAVIGAFAERKVGLTVNLIILVVGGIRLMIGGGII